MSDQMKPSSAMGLGLFGAELAARPLLAKEAATEFSFGGFENAHAADVLALGVLRHLSGGSVNQVRLVLRRAEFWLDATTTLDCDATSFQQADEALLRAFGQEVALRQE
ncbi:hypothetical protein LLG90_13585 [Aromatoleum toluclasticum]|uniref:hypothetical protein n=1 Tax=Aromatoleum toluclasticum TaxID=92003 RepID=UPI001D182E89|nr:hypothetical protein [Aromatoleum toluclasticum]MCC4116387.1 hypothetical protein [Aromatoleum toluclasticum]